MHAELFTDDVARSWAGRCDIFLSDMVNCSVDFERQTEEEVEEMMGLDMDHQAVCKLFATISRKMLL